MNETLETFNNQAINLASHGDFAEAIACFKKALSIEQDNYLLWFNMGVTYRDAGDFKKAKAALDRALLLSRSVGRTGEDVIEVLAQMLYTCGNFNASIEYCRRGLYINPVNPRLWNTLGVVFFSNSAYEEAAEAFEHSLTIDPNYYDALFNLRDTYDELGNKAGKEACENALLLINCKEF